MRLISAPLGCLNDLGFNSEATLRTELKESPAYRDTMVFTKRRPSNVSLGA